MATIVRSVIPLSSGTSDAPPSEPATPSAPDTARTLTPELMGGDGSPIADQPSDPVGIDDPDAASGWVDAVPFRALARRLIEDTGWHWRVVALATELPAGTMRSLLGLGRAPRHAHPRIRRSHALSLWERDANSLLARAQRGELARTARACLRTLIAHGHDISALAAATGLPKPMIIELVSGRRRRCPAMTTWRCLAAAQAHDERQQQIRLRRQRSDATPIKATNQPMRAINGPGARTLSASRPTAGEIGLEAA